MKRGEERRGGGGEESQYAVYVGERRGEEWRRGGEDRRWKEIEEESGGETGGESGGEERVSYKRVECSSPRYPFEVLETS